MTLFNMPIWLVYVSIGFFSLVLLSILLNYTELGRKVCRKYPRVFLQPWEDRQADLLKYISVLWNSPREYILHLRRQGVDVYETIEGYPLLVNSAQSIKTLFVCHFNNGWDNDWRISEIETGRYLYKENTQEAVLTKFVDDIKKKGTKYITDAVSDIPIRDKLLPLLNPNNAERL